MGSWRVKIVGVVSLILVTAIIFLVQNMPKPEVKRVFRPRNMTKTLTAKAKDQEQYTSKLPIITETPGKVRTNTIRKTGLFQKPRFDNSPPKAHAEIFRNPASENMEKPESVFNDDPISKLIRPITNDAISSGHSRSSRMRILCLILTSVSSAGITRMTAVNETWSLRCDRRLFLYSNSEEAPHTQYTLQLPLPEGKSHLTAKVRLALSLAYNTFNDSFDWILKADDDTYVIMENLRHLLAKEDPTQPVYMGFQMKPHNARGYMSGGAGYVISSRALHDVVHKGFKGDACNTDGPDEDVDLGKCLEASGVPIRSSLDRDGKETFHPESLYKHLTDTGSWLHQYAWNQLVIGKDCCSPYSVSFHKVLPWEMHVIDYLLYSIRVYNTTVPKR